MNIKKAVNTVKSWLLKRRRKLSFVLALLFLVLIIFYIHSNWHEFRELDIARPHLLIFLASFAILNLFATGRIMDIVLRPLGLNLHPIESYGLAALSRLTNQVTPGQTGLILRATYLKKKYGLSGADFLSALAGTHIFIYMTAATLGLVSVATLLIQGYAIPKFFSAVLLGVFLALSLLVLVPMRLMATDRKVLKHAVATVNGWQKIKEDRPVLLRSFAWSAVLLGSIIGMVFFSFNSLGASISVLVAAFLTSVIIAGGIISITPSGFGVNEALIVLGAGGVGIDPPMALAAALLQRLVVTVVLYTTTPFMSRRLFGTSLLGTIRRFRQVQAEKP